MSVPSDATSSYDQLLELQGVLRQAISEEEGNATTTDYAFQQRLFHLQDIKKRVNEATNSLYDQYRVAGPNDLTNDAIAKRLKRATKVNVSAMLY
jgi:hypothetical protein